MKISIETPRSFSFKRTALSHGWCQLLPFEFDQETWTMRRVFDAGEAQPVSAIIKGTENAIEVSIPRVTKLDKHARQKITRDVRHIFRLDDDLNEFYEAIDADPGFTWIARAGAGRMLRAPTVFEDLVKTICTTNCSWALTLKMTASLTNKLGAHASDGRRDFPTPQAMAAAPLDFYRDEVRAGYRAPYLKELAERVASGSLDVESWLKSELPTDELKREMKRVKGVGDYAAENLLKLVGRYDVLALDSWVRAKFARTHNQGRACPDAKIARHYARFKSWRGLALWCDMTKDWLENSNE
jgi:3-methyladenine DNA glycosylase/8-oxoguanine DNA glycosylase